GQVGIARLELQVEPLAGGAALIVFEFDLAVNAVIAVGVAAIDLSGFSGDSESLTDENQFAALVINHELALFLHLAGLCLDGRGFKLFLHPIAQENLTAAAGAKNFILAASQCFINPGLIGEGLIEGVA